MEQSPENKENKHYDKAIGVRQNDQQVFEDYLQKRHISAMEFIKDFEVEKTEEEIKYIKFAQEAVNEYLKKYGREDIYEAPIDAVHVLKEDGTKEYTYGNILHGAAATLIGTILIDRQESKLNFTLTVFHELFHLKSFVSLQYTNQKESKERSFKPAREGISVTTRDGKTAYFDDIEEALVAYFTRLFYEEKLKDSKLFDSENIDKPDISRQDESLELDKLIDQILEKNPDKSKREIWDIFINAQINGSLLPVARLVESTFGPGSFRKLGENTKAEF